MGTGCDTTLAQVAECPDCELDDIVVYGVDTDISPYDSGSYASSTAYLTGMAVVKTCESLKKKILKKAAEYLNCSEDDLEFTGKTVRRLNAPEGEQAEITLKDIGNKAMCFNEEASGYRVPYFTCFTATIYGRCCRSGDRQGNRSYRTRSSLQQQ